jgi:flagella basal body P-ring formation protein FlgA
MRMLLSFLLATVAQAGACIEVFSDRVVAGQLVEAVPVLRKLAPETSLGYAPLPGLVRVISGRELSLIATRDGVILPDVPDFCIGRALRPIAPAEMQAALQAALDIPEAEVTVEDYSSQPLPPGKLEFQRSMLSQPPPNARASPVFWRGRLIYDEHHGVPVWAKVKITVDRGVFVATQDIAAGAVLREADVQVSTVREFPFSAPSPESAGEIIGKVSHRMIRAGQRITGNALDEPKEVIRGDIVQVRVIDGSATLSFDGLAVSSGKKGETILVHNSASGRNFRAVVEEKGRAVVRPAVDD